MLNTDAPERTVLIVGEPGIGKSALLAALLDGARGRVVVLAGRCDPLGRDLPLQPLLDGLEVLLRGLGRERAAEVLGADSGVLEPLLGAGHATRPTGTAHASVPVPANPGEVLGQLFAALLRVVERAGAGADGAAVLIVIDDLHLAGPSTVEWLRFAAGPGRGRPASGGAYRRTGGCGSARGPLGPLRRQPAIAARAGHGTSRRHRPGRRAGGGRRIAGILRRRRRDAADGRCARPAAGP
ncbi:MAG: AAA family ATPase [Pseudonocardiaceae bacterium]